MTSSPESPRSGAPTPVGSAQRLLPGRQGHPGLDRLAGLAARLLGTSAAQVSLLTDVQTVAGGAGLAEGSVGSQSPREESLCTVTATQASPLAVPDTKADPRVADLPPVTSGQVGSYLGVPLVADDGHVVGAMCVFDPAPRTWTEHDVAVLEDLAQSAVAELELTALTREYEANQVGAELAVRAGQIGTFDYDLSTGVLRWSDRLVELFGYDRSTFDESIAAFNARVHPDDLPQVSAAIRSSAETAADLEVEYRIIVPGADARWVAARGQVLRDRAGKPARLLGVAYDVTERQERETAVRRVLEAMSAAFYSVDREWRFTYVNAEAERLLQRTRQELLGGDIWELFPAARDSEFETNYRLAMDTGEPVTFEAYYPPPLDGWYEIRAWASPEGLAVYFLDITARRAAEERAERAALRTSLLSEVTAELTETFDAKDAVARLARFLVPALADWCLVTLVVDEDHPDWRRRVADLGSWHADPTMRPVTERYSQIRLSALTDESPVAQALLTTRPVVVARDATARFRSVLSTDEARDLLTQLGPESAVVLPLRGRGRTVGLVSLFNGPERVRLAGDDYETARELAARAGLALDNSRLYRQQRQLAEELQRSMLTAPPEPDHVEIAVRYQPAAESAQVGGDWYDAFLQPGGATVLVVGDVIGHDTAAAAAMGQVRTILRAIGAEDTHGPAQLLQRVDRTLETLQVGTTATAVVARLEQDLDERERGITHLRWSNAGHPPPMVIHPDGEVLPLPGLEADLLLGILPEVPRTQSEIVLDRGSTLLLYTDGLVERRGQSLDDGLLALASTLAELAKRDLPLQDLCTAVLTRMLPERPEDDVALVAVRLHPQDQPRPPEAGPERVPSSVPPHPAD